MKNIVVMGSMALQHIAPGSRSSGLDIDILCKMDDFVPFVNAFRGDQKIVELRPLNNGAKVMVRLESGFVIEAEIAWEDSTAYRMWDYVINRDPGSRDLPLGGVTVTCPSLPFLYMLKMSHRYRKNSPHFIKTMRDIQAMRFMGAKIGKGALKEIYDQRRQDTYNYAHPNLKQSKKDFFSDTVPYKYDHDSIHRAVAVTHVPAYTLVKDAQDEVHIKKENFFASSEMVQLLCTLEEAYVLSLERAIIPFEIKDPEAQKQAFDMALMKVCTSITSGWFRQFSWENYDKVQSMYDPVYLEKFNKALERGEILPFEKNLY